MTESEAKQKWCPMFNGWVSDSEGGGTHYKCKGTECMMFRTARYEGGVVQGVPVRPHTSYYCGLAGKP